MSEQVNLFALEAGIRVSQISILLSAGKHVPGFEIEAALLRLETAVSQLCRQIRIHPCRLSEVVDSCLKDWIKGEAFDDAEGLVERSKPRIAAASVSLGNELMQQYPRESRWFRLGLALADGSDECWSQGVPQRAPRECVLAGVLPSEILVFSNPVPPRWEWRQQEFIDELLAQLGHSLDDFFHRNRVLAYDECDIFQGLEFKRYWGWHAIEFALRAFSQPRLLPRWDSASRTLFLGDRTVYRYQNAAPNQFRVLQAFEDAEWQQPVSCPFENGKKVSQSVTDLDRTTREGGIRFYGGLQGMRWKLVPVSRQPESHA